jgi:Beta-glucosidase/6-phospho-beta-glucosidase/beta-galactosidase
MKWCQRVLIGPSFGYGPVYPLTGDPSDVLASVNADDFNNNWWLDVYCRGEYPYFMMKRLQTMGIAPEVTAADQKLLKSAKPDFLGINYYHGGTVQTNRLQKKVAATDKKDFSSTDPYLMQPKKIRPNHLKSQCLILFLVHIWRRQNGAGKLTRLVSVWLYGKFTRNIAYQFS